MLPDTVNDLPVHALAVHATVVLVPLAALLGVLFAVPRLRGWARLPLPLVAVAAAASTFVSVQSGETLMEAGGQGAAGLGGPVAEIVARHQDLAGQLHVMVWVYAGLAVVAAVLAGRSESAATASGRDAGTDHRPAGRGGVVGSVLSVLLVLAAIAVGVQTYRVGDAGSTAVWNPTGTVDYSGSGG